MDFIHSELNGVGMKIIGGGGLTTSNIILNTNDGEGLNITGFTWALFNSPRIWGNIGNGVVIQPSATQDVYYVHFIGGDIDGNQMNGILFQSPNGNTLSMYQILLQGIQFGDNSLTHGNTYDDIKWTRTGTGSLSQMEISQCGFPAQSSVKYRINFNNSPIGVSNIDINHNNFAVAIGGTGKIYADRSTSRLRIKDNQGYVTETTIYSANFAIDSTGNKTTHTAHLLDMTPEMKNVSVSVVLVTGVLDWSFDKLVIYTVDATHVDVWLNVNVASATAGAVAKFAITLSSLGN